jgi:hypothetical protein
MLQEFPKEAELRKVEEAELAQARAVENELAWKAAHGSKPVEGQADVKVAREDL